MNKTIIYSAVALLAVLGAAPTRAQPKCLEGKTATGECVNPGLAQAAQQIANIFSQQNISQTHYPLLPVDDFKFRYPNNLIPDPLKPSAVGTPVPPSP